MPDIDKSLYTSIFNDVSNYQEKTTNIANLLRVFNLELEQQQRHAENRLLDAEMSDREVQESYRNAYTVLFGKSAKVLENMMFIHQNLRVQLEAIRAMMNTAEDIMIAD